MLRYTWISFVVIFLDQATKFAAENLLTLYQQVPLFPGFNLTLVYNTGAAFSFLSDAGGWQKWFFTGLALAVSTGILLWLRTESAKQAQSRWLVIGLCLIMGGALGNAIDRLLHSHVIDFIDLYYRHYHWPAFNIADIAISTGAALLIFHEIFINRKKTSQHERTEND